MPPRHKSLEEAEVSAIAADWIATAHEVRSPDWAFFLAEFDPYAAAEEALALFFWKHHLESIGFTDATYDRLVDFIDAWYDAEALMYVGGRFAPSPG